MRLVTSTFGTVVSLVAVGRPVTSLSFSSFSPCRAATFIPQPFPSPSRSLFIYLDVAGDAYTGARVAFYDGGGGDDGIVAVRVLARADRLYGRAATEVRLVFVGHSVVVDETETFVLRRSCSNYSGI